MQTVACGQEVVDGDGGICRLNEANRSSGQPHSASLTARVPYVLPEASTRGVPTLMLPRGLSGFRSNRGRAGPLLGAGRSVQKRPLPLVPDKDRLGGAAGAGRLRLGIRPGSRSVSLTPAWCRYLAAVDGSTEPMSGLHWGFGYRSRTDSREVQLRRRLRQTWTALRNNGWEVCPDIGGARVPCVCVGVCSGPRCCPAAFKHPLVEACTSGLWADCAIFRGSGAIDPLRGYYDPWRNGWQGQGQGQGQVFGASFWHEVGEQARRTVGTTWLRHCIFLEAQGHLDSAIRHPLRPPSPTPSLLLEFLWAAPVALQTTHAHREFFSGRDWNRHLPTHTYTRLHLVGGWVEGWMGGWLAH